MGAWQRSGQPLQDAPPVHLSSQGPSTPRSWPHWVQLVPRAFQMSPPCRPPLNVVTVGNKPRGKQMIALPLEKDEKCKIKARACAEFPDGFSPCVTEPSRPQGSCPQSMPGSGSGPQPHTCFLRLSCTEACGIFPHQYSNLRLLHW